MFDFSTVITQVAAFISAGMDVVDPTTPIGGLLLVALGAIVIFGVLKKIKRIIPK